MEQHPFNFSNQFKYRFARHFTFWFCWWAFSSVLYSYTPIMRFLPEFKRLPIAASEAFVFTSLHMFLSYSFIYFVVPVLLIRGRYLLTFISVILLILATGVLNAFLTRYILDDVRNFILDKVFNIHLEYSRPVIYSSFYLSLLAGLRGGITIAGIAAAIKLTKYWYVKNQRNLQLQKENTEAQLQLLKAQVHPHFLFNTLNNIYSYSQNTAPTAAKLVTGLSDMLRYMIYDGNQSLVPLSKELKMVQDFIGLQQIRYQDLEVHAEYPSNTENLYIAPLLLLPLIENCFKHGTSNMLEHPWVSLHVTIEGKEFTMKLVNGKAENYITESKESGIGITNVKKRLELLYPGKHNFKTIDSEDVFIVDLKLELEKAVQPETISKQAIPVHA